MNFLELVMEMDEHINFIKIVVRDNDENIIAYLTKEGIASIMA